MYELAKRSSESKDSEPKSEYGSAFAPPLMSGKIPVPESDDDAAMLLRQSKAAWDAHQDAPAEAKKAHVAAVESAIEAFHNAHPSKFSAHVLQGIKGDSNLKGHR